MKKEDVAFFDRNESYSVLERGLPHWAQAGTLCFITWRLADSLPASACQRLDVDIAIVLGDEGLSAQGDWRAELMLRDDAARGNVHWKLFATRDKYLDAGYGRCLLRKTQHALEVIKSLRHFDEDRYFLTDAVVMPNHCHFIAAFCSEEVMLKQCEEWKRFTARKINAAEGIKGEFWQVDQFDHLIRSESQFEHYRRYIGNNPTAANLRESEYRHFCKEIT